MRAQQELHAEAQAEQTLLDILRLFETQSTINLRNLTRLLRSAICVAYTFGLPKRNRRTSYFMNHYKTTLSAAWRSKATVSMIPMLIPLTIEYLAIPTSSGIGCCDMEKLGNSNVPKSALQLLSLSKVPDIHLRSFIVLTDPRGTSCDSLSYVDIGAIATAYKLVQCILTRFPADSLAFSALWPNGYCLTGPLRSHSFLQLFCKPPHRKEPYSSVVY
ncbi:hypothetical protein T265_02428 [Opisthorchis viverrini]|uniref:Uncharacterized protein n=1 Tax=Opisthorchis viverrini TaxID=6198 RepID=A0A074ZZE1_OPIVI|nr:hypothetical protein T265_02428 [Opisthorchis viverrini]KER31382.1 hypothetical protein T265_02428 [Opisthorchis viverrini]